MINLFDYDGRDGPDISGMTQGTAPAWQFSEEDCDEIRAFAAERRYAAGADITASGTEADALHLILAGTVGLTAHEFSWRQGPGTGFGITAFLTGVSQPLGAVAEVAVVVLVLPRAGLEQVWSWKPRAATVLVRSLAGYAAQRLQSAAIIL